MKSHEISADLDQLKRNGYTSIPKLFSQGYYDELYLLFDEFIDVMTKNRELLEEFRKAGEKWKTIAKNDNLYSNFFTPYYRDRRGLPGKDEKVILQTCELFHTYLTMSYSGMYLDYPIIGNLFNRLMHIILAHNKHLLKLIYELGSEIQKKLIPNNGEIPVSIRILRYENDSLMSTNPHVDKTAFTIILNTNDPINQERLIAHKNVNKSIHLSKYSIPDIPKEDSLLFCGAAFEEFGYQAFKALAHAVLPFNHAKKRYSIILFWHFPDLDMSKFSTSVDFIDDLKLKRNA